LQNEAQKGLGDKFNSEYNEEFKPLFDEFYDKWGVPKEDLTCTRILGYVDTYQSVMFNGNLDPHLSFTLSESSLALLEKYRALGFYLNQFGTELSVKLANEAFRQLVTKEF
jgi:hypothetical protein